MREIEERQLLRDVKQGEFLKESINLRSEYDLEWVKIVQIPGTFADILEYKTNDGEYGFIKI